MNAQAPAGWYPDEPGTERYWDGSAWREQFRPLEVSDAAGPASSTAPKEGAFSKLRRVATDKVAEKRSARDELGRKQADDAQSAGNLVTSGIFGTSTVEIYESGFVRVAEAQSSGTPAAHARTTNATPFEKLRSIKFTQPGQDNAPSTTAALGGAVGPAMALLAKGGAGLLKGSVPGLAVAGITHLAGAEGRKSFLTIATDKKIHTLTNETSNGLITKSNKGHIEVGLALEAAGNSVLGGVGVVAQASAVETNPAPIRSAASEPTLAERLRELAVLHNEGILSDDEFTAAKAKLIAGL